MENLAQLVSAGLLFCPKLSGRVRDLWLGWLLCSSLNHGAILWEFYSIYSAIPLTTEWVWRHLPAPQSANKTVSNFLHILSSLKCQLQIHVNKNDYKWTLKVTCVATFWSMVNSISGFEIRLPSAAVAMNCMGCTQTDCIGEQSLNGTKCT